MPISTPTLKPPTAYALHDHDVVIGERVDHYILKVKDLPSEQKPREKLQRMGPETLNVAELVAVLWGVGTKKEEVLAMARRITREYGEKSIATETNPEKMASALGIPLHKACQIIAGFELGRRFFAHQAGRQIYVRNARQAYEYLHDIGDSKKERLRGLYLNSRYQVVHDEVISVGSLTANIVHPREVFQPAIEHGAVAIIIAHNHPSGSLEPTAADRQVTRQLQEAGRLLGIDVLDHLIIAGAQYIRITEDQLSQ
ncbi:MAG TPA: DNA repair protein RadC [Candidatus Saccharimonadia bacterium]|nr:DNA repair protein RadC [Candidatus Saccharimonadia bacterium]